MTIDINGTKIDSKRRGHGIMKLVTLGTTLIVISLSLSLISSANAIDQHLFKSGIEAIVNLASFQNIMSACKDLYNVGNTDTYPKCLGMIDKLNGMMNQTFTESKADIDEIMKKANYTQPEEFTKQ